MGGRDDMSSKDSCKRGDFYVVLSKQEEEELERMSILGAEFSTTVI